MSELTLYYDGYCPLCVREMDHLRKADQAGRLTLVDIQQEGFTERYPHIDPQAASTILHADTADGELLLGLDVTYRAWSLVGRGFWIAPLRWPVIRWFADKVNSDATPVVHKDVQLTVRNKVITKRSIFPPRAKALSITVVLGWLSLILAGCSSSPVKPLDSEVASLKSRLYLAHGASAGVPYRRLKQLFSGVITTVSKSISFWPAIASQCWPMIPGSVKKTVDGTMVRHLNLCIFGMCIRMN